MLRNYKISITITTKIKSRLDLLIISLLMKPLILLHFFHFVESRRQFANRWVFLVSVFTIIYYNYIIYCFLLGIYSLLFYFIYINIYNRGSYTQITQ